MKKIHFLLLISLLLAACSDDDKEKQPAFVTNITISDAGKTFNPGDAVTVKADGLQSGDQIILDIYWPIADNPLFPEGYSRYTRAVTTEQTTNSLSQIYSDLHQNIQDAFNEAGIEIMSPHYIATRDGSETTIPKDDLREKKQ